jgi:hypothetical protein
MEQSCILLAVMKMIVFEITNLQYVFALFLNVRKLIIAEFLHFQIQVWLNKKGQTRTHFYET